MRVIRRKSWRQKGKKKKLTGQRRKGRVNVMGGLRYNDKKRICYFIEKGESETFYNKIGSLNEAVKKEWVSLGNQESDFTNDGPRIIIILDNASFHKKKEIIEKIESELPNIILEYLPEYSPDYNLIELVWHSTKEYVAHRLFKSVQELETTLDKLLNQGKLQIKWKKRAKIKVMLLLQVKCGLAYKFGRNAIQIQIAQSNTSRSRSYGDNRQLQAIPESAIAQEHLKSVLKKKSPLTSFPESVTSASSKDEPDFSPQSDLTPEQLEMLKQAIAEEAKYTKYRDRARDTWDEFGQANVVQFVNP